MAKQRRKSITENEVRTILAVWSSILEKYHWDYNQINTVIGSLTIVEMQDLYSKLRNWYNQDAIEAEREEW